jgi:hypothetical protein
MHQFTGKLKFYSNSHNGTILPKPSLWSTHSLGESNTENEEDFTAVSPLKTLGKRAAEEDFTALSPRKKLGKY